MKNKIFAGLAGFFIITSLFAGFCSAAITKSDPEMKLVVNNHFEIHLEKKIWDGVNIGYKYEPMPSFPEVHIKDCFYESTANGYGISSTIWQSIGGKKKYVTKIPLNIYKQIIALRNKYLDSASGNQNTISEEVLSGDNPTKNENAIFEQGSPLTMQAFKLFFADKNYPLTLKFETPVEIISATQKHKQEDYRQPVKELSTQNAIGYYGIWHSNNAKIPGTVLILADIYSTRSSKGVQGYDVRVDFFSVKAKEITEQNVMSALIDAKNYFIDKYAETIPSLGFRTKSGLYKINLYMAEGIMQQVKQLKRKEIEYIRYEENTPLFFLQITNDKNQIINYFTAERIIILPREYTVSKNTSSKKNKLKYVGRQQ